MRSRFSLIAAAAALFCLPIAGAHTLPAEHFAGAFAHPRVPDAETKPLAIEVTAEPTPQGGTTHSAKLTWTAPAAGNCTLSGYNIKRSTSTGTEITIATAASTATAFTDSSVTGGTTYFWVVTATTNTTSCNSESVPSNEVTAAIPKDSIGAPTGLSVGNVQ